MASDNARRISEYRKRSKLKGIRRIEVTAHERDIALVKGVTKILRENSKTADRVREVLDKFLPKDQGENLVDFFKNSPLTEEVIEFERDKDAGREIDL